MPGILRSLKQFVNCYIQFRDVKLVAFCYLLCRLRVSLLERPAASKRRSTQTSWEVAPSSRPLLGRSRGRPPEHVATIDQEDFASKLVMMVLIRPAFRNRMGSGSQHDENKASHPFD